MDLPLVALAFLTPSILMLLAGAFLASVRTRLDHVPPAIIPSQATSRPSRGGRGRRASAATPTATRTRMSDESWGPSSHGSSSHGGAA
jgi:hypothetical protein